MTCFQSRRLKSRINGAPSLKVVWVKGSVSLMSWTNSERIDFSDKTEDEPLVEIWIKWLKMSWQSVNVTNMVSTTQQPQQPQQQSHTLTLQANATRVENRETIEQTSITPMNNNTHRTNQNKHIYLFTRDGFTTIAQKILTIEKK